MNDKATERWAGPRVSEHVCLARRNEAETSAEAPFPARAKPRPPGPGADPVRAAGVSASSVLNNKNKNGTKT